jgi:hypothetical protein
MPNAEVHRNECPLDRLRPVRFTPLRRLHVPRKSPMRPGEAGEARIAYAGHNVWGRDSTCGDQWEKAHATAVSRGTFRVLSFGASAIWPRGTRVDAVMSRQ